MAGRDGLCCDAPVAGNADVHSEVLARAAVEGDRDAFAELFQRHLDEVFTAAWRVVGDRETAAKLARDAFTQAWRDLDATPPEVFVEHLLRLADHRAHAWVLANPRTERPEPAEEAPPLGPVHRARIVALLQVDGVPTRVKHRPEDTASSRPVRRGLAAAVLAVTLCGLGVVQLRGGADKPDASAGEDGVEVATGSQRRAASAQRTPAASTTSTTGAPIDQSSTTTSSLQPTTTTASAEAATSPPAPTPTAPPTSAAPTTTASTGPLPDPVIHGFDGHASGDTCPGGQYVVDMWWDTEHATSVKLRPRGGDRIDVAVDSTFRACSDIGSEWVLNAMNATGTETATFTVRAP